MRSVGKNGRGKSAFNGNEVVSPFFLLSCQQIYCLRPFWCSAFLPNFYVSSSCCVRNRIFFISFPTLCLINWITTCWCECDNTQNNGVDDDIGHWCGFAVRRASLLRTEADDFGLPIFFVLFVSVCRIAWELGLGIRRRIFFYCAENKNNVKTTEEQCRVNYGVQKKEVPANECVFVFVCTCNSHFSCKRWNVECLWCSATNDAVHWVR